MENGETTCQAAVRETEEESGANIELHELISMINVTHVDQIHLFYRATLLDLNYAAGTESLEVAMFSEAEIPWDQIAFQTVVQTLQYYFEQSRTADNPPPFKLYCNNIFKPRHS